MNLYLLKYNSNSSRNLITNLKRSLFVQGKKMFQIATRPSLPVETICLSSGLKAMAAIAPE
jgi:hypothetical protein